MCLSTKDLQMLKEAVDTKTDTKIARRVLLRTARNCAASTR